MNQFAVALTGQTGVVEYGRSEKTGKVKTGSLARAFAFMNKQERLSTSQLMYAKWLNNGQFVPLARDILSCGLVSKDAEQALAIQCGLTRNQVNKEAFFMLCETVDSIVRGKTKKNGEPVAEPKPTSEKGFTLTLVRKVLEGAQEGQTIDAE